MFIVSWDRKRIVNANKVYHISLEKNRIIAETQSLEFALGIYSTAERAEEVFSETLSRMFIPNMILVNGRVDGDKLSEKFKEDTNKPWAVAITGENTSIIPVTREIYYMPEE